jgi:hypothetical protein
MQQEPPVTQANESPTGETGSLSDLLQELRVLLQGVQVLTGFLIILPFYQNFPHIEPAEKLVYLATFACSLTGLILFSAPAAQHRLEWPLRDRAQFKRFATHMIVVGLVPSSLALVLAAQLIVSQILDGVAGVVAAALVAAVLGVAWWLFPLIARRQWDTTSTSRPTR